MSNTDSLLCIFLRYLAHTVVRMSRVMHITSLCCSYDFHQTIVCMIVPQEQERITNHQSQTTVHIFKVKLSNYPSSYLMSAICNIL